MSRRRSAFACLGSPAPITSSGGRRRLVASLLRGFGSVTQVEGGVESLAWVAISVAIDHEIVFGDGGARLT
jgi:hypothetical protein